MSFHLGLHCLLRLKLSLGTLSIIIQKYRPITPYNRKRNIPNLRYMYRYIWKINQNEKGQVFWNVVWDMRDSCYTANIWASKASALYFVTFHTCVVTLKTCIHRSLIELAAENLIWVFIRVPTLCAQSSKADIRLRLGILVSQPFMLAYVLWTSISLNGLFTIVLHCEKFKCKVTPKKVASYLPPL